MQKAVQFEVGSPINNGNVDDDLDFAKELLDGANGGNLGGGAPMLEHSRIEGGDFQPPVLQAPPAPKPKPTPPPKQLSMAEMVALAASNLKKPPAAGEPKRDIPIPKKGGANKEETKDAPQARTSNMDALKAQIMLRK